MSYGWVPPEEHPGRAAGESWVLLGIGAALLLVAMVLHLLTFYNGHSLSELNGLCSTTFGQLAQASSSSVQSRCQMVSVGEQVQGWALILGIVACAGGLVMTYRRFNNRG